MRVVLDTNVLVSAFLKPQSKPAKILRLILQGKLDIVISAPILSEYDDVLTRPKFNLEPLRTRTILSIMRSIGVNAPAFSETIQLPDEKDAPFLEAALATNADVLITGNMRHFPEAFRKGQTVMSPADFLNRIGKSNHLC